MKRISCFICGGDASDASDSEYVDVSVRFPGVDSPQIQWFGGHASCIDAAAAPGYYVYRPSGHDIEAEPRPRLVAVPRYEAAHGVRVDVEGGHLDARLSGDHVALTGNPAGLRDLARWCLALSDPDVPDHSKVRLDPGEVPISDGSTPMLLARATASDF